MEALDFATVFYRPETNMMRAQAHSFAIHVPVEIVNKIYLIVHGSDIDTNSIDEIVSLFGPHRQKIQVVSATDVAPNLQSWTHGWWAQQILKLRIAALSGVEHVVVLDAKNHFIKPLSFERLFTEDKKIKTWSLSYVSNAEEHCRGSFAYFGLSVDSYVEKLPPSITPITLKPTIVRDLVRFFEDKAGGEFEAEFISHLNVTEFLAYYAFIIYGGASLEDVFEYGDPQVATLFLDKVQDLNRFHATIHQANQPTRFMFGIHRMSIPHLSAIHKERIFDLWKNAGIYMSDEESNRWLTLVE